MHRVDSENIYLRVIDTLIEVQLHTVQTRLNIQIKGHSTVFCLLQRQHLEIYFMPYLVKSKFHVFNLSLIVWLPREGIHRYFTLLKIILSNVKYLCVQLLYLTLAKTTSEKPQYLMPQI